MLIMDDKEILERFAANLRRAMDDRGCSGMWLARQIGMTKAAVYGYLRRENMPSLYAVVMICRALHIDPDELIGWERDE